jgi:hypothetical protein
MQGYARRVRKRARVIAKGAAREAHGTSNGTSPDDQAIAVIRGMSGHWRQKSMIDQTLQWALPACPDAHALPIDYRPVGLMGWLGCVQLPPNTAW